MKIGIKKSTKEGISVILHNDKAIINQEIIYYFDSIIRSPARVPVGFKTDLASVPRIFRPFAPILGKYNRAAIVHDYLYSAESSSMITRKEADEAFLHIMELYNVKKYKRLAMYYSVRLCGWKYWKKL